MTALSPLANLIAALEVQLTAAAPAPETASPSAPFLDVFGGLMAMPESEPQPPQQEKFRSHTESERNPAPAPKAKKSANSPEPVVTGQVMPTPEIVPVVPVAPLVAAIPILPVVPVKLVEQVEEALAPTQSAPAPAVAVAAARIPSDISLQSEAPPVLAEHTDTPEPVHFQETLRKAIGTPPPIAPDRPVQPEAFEAPLRPSEHTIAQAPAPGAPIAEAPIPFAGTHEPREREAPWQPSLTRDTPPSFDVPDEAAPRAAEKPRVTVQSLPSFDVPTKATPRPAAPHRPVPSPGAAPEPRATEPEAAVSQDDAEARPVPLAFAAKLVPVEEPASGTKVDPKPQPKIPTKADAPAISDSSTFEPAPSGEPVVPRTAKIQPADMPRDRKAAPVDNSRERKIAPADAPDAAPESRVILPVSTHEAAPAVRTSEPADRTPAPPLTELPAEVAKPAQPPAAARDIRLELAGGDTKVEVRLMERAGEVHVAVRTADTQLAGALRENLPSLSARLEQTGMRAESWHPGAETTGPRRVDTAQASRGEQGDTRQHSQSQGREQRDSHPRRSREVQDPVNRKEKGTPFSWFMPSHT